MMKGLVVSALLLISTLPGFAQPLPDRYREEIFSEVMETSNVQFSTGIPKPNNGGGWYQFFTGLPLNVNEYSTSPVNLNMDIFEPIGDTLSKRPVIIICFGGAFLSGSRQHWSIRLLAQQLARRGFVTATIDYRLGMNVFDADLAMRAVYRGVQDGRSAVRFFRADAAGANQYRIDPEQIFIGGHSSGGFIALHNAYLETEEERPISTYTWPQGSNTCPDQLCLDCVGNNQEYSGHANAIFSLAGALGYTDLIDTEDDPRPVLFHSTDDETVPYESGEPLSSVLVLVVGSDLPVVFGSNPISMRCDTVGLEYEFYSYTDRGHGVHEETETELYDDILPGISDWFHSQRLKPASHELSGAQAICIQDSIQVYLATPGTAGYYDWEIIGGTIIAGSNSSEEVTVSWDPNAAMRELRVTPYSIWGARGDSSNLEIEIIDGGSNTWTGTVDSNWAEPGNWTAGHIPLTCEDVIFPSSTEPIIVTIPSDQVEIIKSLVAGLQVEIVIEDGAALRIIGDN